jgi:XTP/dITP diphosphohydrolase
MNKLVLATNNPHKISEIKDIMSGLEIEVLSAADFRDFPEIEETGKTLEENAALKARAIWQLYRLPSMADDTGLEVEHLNGLPGVYSARFAGPGCTYKDNYKKLLALLEDIPRSNRCARFRTAIAFIDADENLHEVSGELNGIIADAPRGNFGFGYDPVFIVEGTYKTLAEMLPAEKNVVSHRARALTKIRPVIVNALTAKSR